MRAVDHHPLWEVCLTFLTGLFFARRAFVPEARVDGNEIVLYKSLFPSRTRIPIESVLSAGFPKEDSWGSGVIELQTIAGEKHRLQLERPVEFVDLLASLQHSVNPLPLLPPLYTSQVIRRKLRPSEWFALVYDHKSHTIHAPDEDPPAKQLK